MRVVQRPAVTAAVPAPAKWRVVGELRDQTELPGLLEWRDPGGLTGSPEAMKAVTELLATGLPVAVTPTGPFIPADRHDEQSAYVRRRGRRHPAGPPADGRPRRRDRLKHRSLREKPPDSR